MSESQLGDKVLGTFEWTLPKDKLVRLQLGDLFFKGESDPVFLVINAGCDLMFTPTAVSRKRPAEPSSTIYLLPGELRATKDCPSNGLTTGLIRLDESWKCIVWDSKKVVAIPHGMVERYLRKQEYRHELRLRTSRAIEIQQQVFHNASRIGLEVQPPICEELNLRLMIRKAKGFALLSTTIDGGAVRFHTPRQTVIVLKPSAITAICDRLIEVLEKDASALGKSGQSLKKAEADIRNSAAAIAKTPLKEPSKTKPSLLQGASGHTKINQPTVGIVFWSGETDTSGWNQNLAVVLGIEEKA